MSKKSNPVKAEVQETVTPEEAQAAEVTTSEEASTAPSGTPPESDEGPTLSGSDYFDGMSKSGLDFELDTLAGDLRRDLLDRLKQLRAPWPQLTNHEQTDAANGVDLYARSVIKRLVYLLTRETFDSTAVKLFDVQIKGSKGIVGKVSCDNVYENLRLMTENCDTLVKLVFVDSTVFMGEREKEEADPDQPELPISGVNDDQEKALADAIIATISEGRASTSFIQRKLNIGYNKAADLIGKMENLGIITGADDKGARRVLASDPQKALEAAGLAEPEAEVEAAEEPQEALPLAKPSADLASPDDLPPGISASDVE